MRRLLYPRGGSGESGITWYQVNPSSPTINDPAGLTSSRSFSSGVLRARMSSSTAIANHLRAANLPLYFTVPINQILPSFDWKTQRMWFAVDPLVTAHSNAEVGLFGGIVDEATLGAATEGRAIGVSDGTTLQDALQGIGISAANVLAANGFVGRQAVGGLTFGFSGGVYPAAWDISLRGANGIQGQANSPVGSGDLRSDPFACHGIFGINCRTADPRTSRLISGSFWVGVQTLTFPQLLREVLGARPTSGVISVGIKGDSIGAGGNAGGPTAGSPLPAYLLSGAGGTYNDTGGTVRTTWDASPGIIPSLAAALNAAGFTGVRIYRQAVSTIRTERILNEYMDNILSRMDTDGVAPDLMIGISGTNDATSGLSSVMPGLLGRYDQLQKVYPNCRGAHCEPIATDAAYVEVPQVRSAIRAAMAGPGRKAISGEGRTTAGDNIHATIETFDAWGAEIAAWYLST